MADPAKKILVVDDDREIRIFLFEVLKGAGYDVEVAEDGLMALELIERNTPDLVIADIRMPQMDGIKLLQKIKAKAPQLPVMIITGYASIETAVQAMKAGAFDYIIKPLARESVIENVVRVFAAEIEIPDQVLPESRKAIKRQKRPIIGMNEKLLQILAKAKTVASSKATILVLGESGTGKEVFARYIHNESDRAKGSFVALNCAALPEGLLESELFGHEKGAFTGAIVTKKGKFELADGGTLLLDEIGEIPLHLQAKLLRVLQEEEIDRLGGQAPVKIDVHVVATTNRSLQDAVKAGEFREDLFYRLNVIPLRLPSLRERKDDIELLAEYFIGKFSAQYNKPTKKLSARSVEVFKQYSWPGNVREMENLIERAVLLGFSEEFEPWDFWDEEELRQAGVAASAAGGIPVNRQSGIAQNSGSSSEGTASLKDVERQMILQALHKTDNNRTHAAKMLGISVRTLRNKLHEYRSLGTIE
ncbi:MAG: sigma-54 dependent transcriptional regulator [Proteobacteria bacterium]|nr:sigma-54 dependent transcriptional regulator [Pseudomonadota bacterium]MBU1710543.1 sigma-54 dependent transcriptional regulator [Pseudomonadota bacterium]